MDDSRERAKETIRKRYGKEYWKRMATAQQRTERQGFRNPNIAKKALETRRRNRELKDALQDTD